jgi:hypothetical protein
VDILVGLLDITGNIEGVAGSLWDSETIIESNCGGYSTETLSSLARL